MTEESRIELLGVEEALGIARQNGVGEQIAGLNVFRVLLHHPALAVAIENLLMSMLSGDNKLSHRARELIIMRIGWVTGSNYEWTQHWRVAPLYGVPEEDLVALRDWESATCFDDADKAVLKATDESIADGKVSAATWVECEKHYSTKEELIEMCGALGTWRLISLIAQSINFPVEEGVASWPPDGRKSPAAD